jgi:serine/threonine protein kinase
LYILLGGYPPFIESTQRDLFRKIRKGEYEFHEEYWGTVSLEAKELISSLLTVDANKRLTAADALHNAWITGQEKVPRRRQFDYCGEQAQLPQGGVLHDAQGNDSADRRRKGNVLADAQFFWMRSCIVDFEVSSIAFVALEVSVC